MVAAVSVRSPRPPSSILATWKGGWKSNYHCSFHVSYNVKRTDSSTRYGSASLIAIASSRLQLIAEFDSRGHFQLAQSPQCIGTLVVVCPHLRFKLSNLQSPSLAKRSVIRGPLNPVDCLVVTSPAQPRYDKTRGFISINSGLSDCVTHRRTKRCVV